MLFVVPSLLSRAHIHVCKTTVFDFYFCSFAFCLGKRKKSIEIKQLPWPGFEPGLLRPQRRVLTTRRSRPAKGRAANLGFDSHRNTSRWRVEKNDRFNQRIRRKHYLWRSDKRLVLFNPTNLCLANGSASKFKRWCHPWPNPSHQLNTKTKYTKQSHKVRMLRSRLPAAARKSASLFLDTNSDVQMHFLWGLRVSLQQETVRCIPSLCFLWSFLPHVLTISWCSSSALSLKIDRGTKFVWAKWHVAITQNETFLLEVHRSPLVVSWWHEQKTEKKRTSIDCCVKFLLGQVTGV